LTYGGKKRVQATRTKDSKVKNTIYRGEGIRRQTWKRRGSEKRSWPTGGEKRYQVFQGDKRVSHVIEEDSLIGIKLKIHLERTLSSNGENLSGMQVAKDRLGNNSKEKNARTDLGGTGNREKKGTWTGNFLENKSRFQDGAERGPLLKNFGA